LLPFYAFEIVTCNATLKTAADDTRAARIKTGFFSVPLCHQW
jgi:hypothetical protein